MKFTCLWNVGPCRISVAVSARPWIWIGRRPLTSCWIVRIEVSTDEDVRSVFGGNLGYNFSSRGWFRRTKEDGRSSEFFFSSRRRNLYHLLFVLLFVCCKVVLDLCDLRTSQTELRKMV